MRALSAFLCLFLCACAAKAPAPEIRNCEEALVILPDNYVIDLASGSTVFVNPGLQEFALFCDRASAKDALAKANAELPGSWRAYKLSGDPASLIEADENNYYRLARQAEVEDWVDL